MRVVKFLHGIHASVYVVQFVRRQNGPIGFAPGSGYVPRKPKNCAFLGGGGGVGNYHATIF